jgi:hypothetical protein
VNLAASRGVAVREFVMKRPHGRADYLLFLDRRAAGLVEAKKEGETLTGVEHQSAKYVDGLPDALEPAVEGGLSFVYESTGTETRFTNRLDPDPASRPVFSFHRPETLAGWLDEIRRHPEDRSARAESERFRRFGYDELVARDKASLDITWLRDDSLEDTENLPAPEVIAQEIIEDLEAALVEFAAVAQAVAKDDEASTTV